MKKKRGPFRQGFWFGGGFMVAAYLVMFLVDNVGEMVFMLFAVIMKSLGFESGT